MKNQLGQIIQKITENGKGILAADESIPTITKRFSTIHLDCTLETRRKYRELIFTTPGLENYISGIILFEETLDQSTSSGENFTELLKNSGILSGIKVDKGLVTFLNSKEKILTQGLDGLNERLENYKAKGAQFAKWRAIFNADPSKNSTSIIDINSQNLAIYAAICQSHELVPIVEPEILMDGPHSLSDCEKTTEFVLHKVFDALVRFNVKLEYIILKPNMILAGSHNPDITPPSIVAESTLRVFKRTVPACVPSINFLSGGQSPNRATENLNALNQVSQIPWNLSFSFGRALLDPCLKTWQGHDKNALLAQNQLLERAKLNAYACTRGNRKN